MIANNYANKIYFLKNLEKFWVKNNFKIFMIAPALVYSLTFAIIVVVYLLKLSLTHISGSISSFPSIVNFLEILKSVEFKESFIRTIIFVLIGTPLQLIAGFYLAMLINKKFKGIGIIRSIFLLPISIPSLVTATIVAYMLFCYPGGHINDFLTGKLFFPQLIKHSINWYTSQTLSLGLAMFTKVWRDMPISMLIILAGLQSITQDQYEAADTMGANASQKFFYITIPLLIPAISTVLILRSIEMWKEFIFPFIISPSYPTIGVLIEYIYHEQRNPYLGATVSVILFISILLFSVLINFLLKKIKNYLIKY